MLLGLIVTSYRLSCCMITCWLVIFADKHCYMDMVAFYFLFTIMSTTLTPLFSWYNIQYKIFREFKYDKVQEWLFFLTLECKLVTAPLFFVFCGNQGTPRKIHSDFVSQKAEEEMYRALWRHSWIPDQKIRVALWSTLMAWEKRRVSRMGYIGASLLRHKYTHADNLCGVVQV